MARTALIRLTAFVLVLLGTFGTAYGVGTRFPGNPAVSTVGLTVVEP